MEERTAERQKIDIGAAFRLWIGTLLPPAAWLAQLQALYLSSEFGCTTSNFTNNHIVVVVALSVSLLGWAIAWREWTKRREDTTDRRSRFMALVGTLGGTLFTILIFAQWLPTIMGVPCDK